ncbi:MAG: DNA polymerase III subunit chi [Pseudomonadota bacterium]
MKLDFWQLSRDPADKVTALIAGRVLGQDERLLVVSSDAAQREAISRALWSAGPETFLANGDADKPGADRQPILLSETTQPANGASHVIFADGTYRETEGFARAFLLFDDETLQSARQTWKALEDREGLERAFFRQDGGKWVKVA